MNIQEIIEQVTVTLEQINNQIEEQELYLCLTEEALRSEVHTHCGISQAFLLERQKHFIGRRDELRHQKFTTEAFLNIKKAEANMPSFFLS